MAQKKFIIDGGFQTSDDSSISANLEMTGHILPTVDSDGTTGYDLGSTTKKWRDLFLSQGSLYVDGQKVLHSDSGTIVVSADNNQGLLTRTTGSGQIAFASDQPISVQQTLQMGSGKKITDAGGTAVVFGDKIDADSNKIVNVGTPTAATDGANKSYVDDAISDLVNGAPGALDTLNEIANALGDDANYAATITTALASASTDRAAIRTEFAAADTAINTAWAAADTAQTTALETYADTAEADAKAYTDTRETAITTAYESYADTAETDAKAYTDTRETAINTAWAAADTAQTSSINTAWAAGDAAVTTAMQTYADTAEADAISTASADASTKASAAQTAAEATASADATAKANAAQTAAASYTDTEVANLVDSAPGAIDTLNELAAALGDDANFSATMTTALGLKAATTYVDTQDAATLSSAQSYADQAEADAISTAAADATTKADQAEADAISTAAADATTKANAAQAAAATDATTKADAEHSYIDAREVAITSAYRTYADNAEADAISTAAADATTKADAAEADAISTAAADATSKADAAEVDAKAYTDTREAAINTAWAAADAAQTTALETYADTAEADAISTAAADATTKADAAQAAAEATASADATAKDTAQTTAITTAYQTYADQAEADAISTAAADATTKADAARAAAVSDVTNGAGAAFDTLKEIQDAMATDAELSAAISGLTIGDGTMTVTAGAGMTGGGSFTANQTGNSSVTLNAIAGNGITVNANDIAMSGSFTGGFTATGDITAYSDESLKTNIQTIDNALNRVEAVRGVTFERLEDGSVSTGVVAQELNAVLPEAVHTDANGLHHVAYGNITGLLIEAVKELSAEVKELKK